MKKKHGKYVLINSKGFFIFDSRIKKGRSFFKKKKEYDINFKSHPKMVKSIVKLGSWNATSREIKVKEVKGWK